MKKFFTSTLDFTRNLYASLKLNFKAAPGFTFLIVGIVIITASIPFGTSKVAATIIDTLIATIQTGVSSGNTVLFYAALWAIMDGLGGVVGGFRSFAGYRQGYLVKTKLEFDVLQKLTELDKGRYENPDFQNLLQRVFGTRGQWPLQELGINFLTRTLWDVVEVVIATLIIGFFDWRILALIVATSIPRFITDLKLSQKSYDIWNKEEGEEQRRYYNYRSHIRDFKVGVTELRSYQASKKFLGLIKSIYDSTNSDLVKNEKRRLWLTLIVELIAMAGFGISIYFVINGVVSAGLAIGQMTFIVASISRLGGSISDLLYSISSMFDTNRYIKDILAFLNTKPLVTTPNPVQFQLFETPPTITFENVSFAYPGTTTQILKNLSFTIEPGQKIGLVGNNGAGKSTFIKLLCRIYDPSEGRILVNGVDLKNIDPLVWQSYLSVLMQDFASYEFTVKESIAISQPEAPYDHERMLWSAKVSQAREFIEQWEKKYDEQLGVEFKGKEPSKGQRQKLALARTFYRKAPIMLLDEPTAAVDAESEIEIFKELDAMPKNITGIFISHEFSTIRRADRILVMVQGALTEDGTHEELVAKQGTYARLYAEQVKSLVAEK